MAEKSDLGYAYLVFSGSNNNYYAKNGKTGKVDYSGSWATTVINSALTNLTSGRKTIETVKLKGYFYLTGSILVDPFTRLDMYESTLFLSGSGSRYPAIANKSLLYTGSIELIGGLIDPNWTSGSVIKLIGYGADVPSPFLIKDLSIGFEGCASETSAEIYGGMEGSCAFYLQSLNLLRMENIFVIDRYAMGGLIIPSCSDSEYINVDLAIYGNTTNVISGSTIYLNSSCTTNQFTNCYFGGGKQILLSGAYDNIWVNCCTNDLSNGGFKVIDGPGPVPSILNQIVGCHFGSNSSTANTHSDIEFSGSANRNTVIGCNFWQGVPSKASKYGVEEQQNADYNIIIGCTFTGSGTGPVYIKGTHTVSGSCIWN